MGSRALFCEISVKSLRPSRNISRFAQTSSRLFYLMISSSTPFARNSWMMAQGSKSSFSLQYSLKFSLVLVPTRRKLPEPPLVRMALPGES